MRGKRKDGKLTSEEELLGTESAGREDDTTAGVDVDGSAVAAGGQALELNARDLAAGADGAPDTAVHPQAEVGAAEGRDEVGGQGAATLAVREHEGGVA